MIDKALQEKIASKRAATSKRRENREKAPGILRANTIEFDSLRADGSRLLVDGGVIFYPGTGLWRERGTRQEGRGIFGLIAYVKNVRRLAGGSPQSGVSVGTS